jgi:hypothetical protein
MSDDRVVGRPDRVMGRPYRPPPRRDEEGSVEIYRPVTSADPKPRDEDWSEEIYRPVTSTVPPLGMSREDFRKRFPSRGMSREKFKKFEPEHAKRLLETDDDEG